MFNIKLKNVHTINYILLERGWVPIEAPWKEGVIILKQFFSKKFFVFLFLGLFLLLYLWATRPVNLSSMLQNQQVNSITITYWSIPAGKDAQQTSISTQDTQETEEFLQFFKKQPLHHAIDWRKWLGMGVGGYSEDTAEIEVHILYGDKNNLRWYMERISSVGTITVFTTENMYSSRWDPSNDYIGRIGRLGKARTKAYFKKLKQVYLKNWEKSIWNKDGAS